MSDSVRPHGRRTTRLPHPWDSPGKNTGVGCQFLLQCMKVRSESEIAQLCLTHHDPMDCSPRGSSVHGIFQARVLEWVAIAFSLYVSTTSYLLIHLLEDTWVLLTPEHLILPISEYEMSAFIWVFLNFFQPTIFRFHILGYVYS